MKQILEGSRAIALTIKNIRPAVISAYPITPQTHIVEDLASFKADGKADYEYVRAESEFAAASIVEGASATGVRVYTATSSQGLLLMTEVIFNISGMRLPIVMTCANRAVSAPINIWNDQQDSMTIRDAGWIMLYAENSQEAVNQHIIGYKIAEQLKIPVMVNVDGYVLTHTYEPVIIPEEDAIKKFLPDYSPIAEEFLDPEHPITFGAFAAPTHYMEIREDLHKDLIASKKIIAEEYEKFKKSFDSEITAHGMQSTDNGLIEYYGPENPATLLVAMGSVIGTIKEAVDEHNKTKNNLHNSPVGVLKIKCYRPFPYEAVLEVIGKSKNIAVIDKSIMLGELGPLATDIRSAAQSENLKIMSYIVGLGGRDITRDMIHKIIADAQTKASSNEAVFIGK